MVDFYGKCREIYNRPMDPMGSDILYTKSTLLSETKISHLDFFGNHPLKKYLFWEGICDRFC